MVAKRWPALIIAVMAASFTFITRGAAPATNIMPVAFSTSCPAAEIIGVHGTGEGPSPIGKEISSEIKATFAAFTADERKLGEHGARLQYFPYPTLDLTDYLPTNWAKSQLMVNNCVGELGAEAERFSRSCPNSPISLVGYSLGSLLINIMLSSHDDEWNYIDAVEFYGDPCWYNPDGGYRGLAQYADETDLLLACLKNNSYPDPLFFRVGFHFAAQSLCLTRDPACGQGWPPYQIGDQVIAALLCPLDRCPHLSYVGTATRDGANSYPEMPSNRRITPLRDIRLPFKGDIATRTQDAQNRLHDR
jgi:hypothetical protein